jgi:hypothetical protein
MRSIKLQAIADPSRMMVPGTALQSPEPIFPRIELDAATAAVAAKGGTAGGNKQKQKPKHQQQQQKKQKAVPDLAAATSATAPAQ